MPLFPKEKDDENDGSGDGSAADCAARTGEGSGCRTATGLQTEGTPQWTYDWRLIEEPEGLTEKWDGVFWSLVRKQREKHWLKFQYYSYLEDRKLDNAAVLVSEFVDNQTAQKVKAENIEDRRDAKRQQFIEERMTTHQAVEDWLKDKPGMTPGKAMEDALPAGPVERFPADAPQALLTPRQ